jgi:BirA family biotin operon repressor/biotin-[acetyl-CoA-carboxylase] ligase
VLGTGQTVWAAELGADPHLVIIIDEAPTSQFTALAQALAAKTPLPSGLIAIALTGRGFRGQRGRSWQALRGNLHLCAYYLLDLPAAAVQAAVSMLPAVAAAQGIEALSNGRLKPGIKWVNDLVLLGRKVAGVLCSTQVQGERITSALFGIGINLARAPALSEQPTGALAEHDPTLAEALPALAWAVIGALETGLKWLCTDNAEAIYRHYLERAAFLGKEVILWPEGNQAGRPLARGRVVGLNPDLSLVLEGHQNPIRSGRMVMRE